MKSTDDHVLWDSIFVFNQHNTDVAYEGKMLFQYRIVAYSSDPLEGKS